MSILSFDALQAVEKTIGSAVSIIFSTLKSVYLILLRPKPSSRLLQRRFKSDSDHQLGPLTLVFIMFVVLLLAGEYLDQQSILRKLNKIAGHEGEATIISIVIAALIGSGLLDIYARVCSNSTLPTLRRGSLIKTDKTTYSDYRNRILYSFVQYLAFATALFVFTNLKFSFLADTCVALLLIFIILLRADFASHRVFFRTPASRLKSTRRIMAVLTSLMYFVISIVITILASLLVKSAYPSNESIKLATPEEISIFNSSCTYVNNSFIVIGKILNESHGSAVIKLPKEVKIYKKGMSEYYSAISRDVTDENAERIVKSAQIIPVRAIYNIQGAFPANEIEYCSARLEVMTRFGFEDKYFIFDSFSR